MAITAETLQGVRNYMACTNGTEDYHQHALCARLVYTDGVHFVAEQLRAWWLVDAIASHQISRRVRGEAFQVWTLHARDGSAVCLACTDGNENRVTSQAIDYSDFPRELLPFTLWAEQSGSRIVLMLPGER